MAMPTHIVAVGAFVENEQRKNGKTEFREIDKSITS